MSNDQNDAEITPKKYVTDTMALVLWLENRKLPAKVKGIFEATTSLLASNSQILIPGTVLAEIAYLSEKNRIDTSLQAVEKLILDSKDRFVVFTHGMEDIKSAFEITDIPELHDRLIAGVGRFLQLEVLTNDPKIINSAFVRTLWE